MWIPKWRKRNSQNYCDIDNNQIFLDALGVKSAALYILHRETSIPVSRLHGVRVEHHSGVYSSVCLSVHSAC